MIKDQLHELRVRLDQMEQVALAIPTEYWPDAFDAVLQGWEIRVGMAARELDQDFSTKETLREGRVRRLSPKESEPEPEPVARNWKNSEPQ